MNHFCPVKAPGTTREAALTVQEKNNSPCSRRVYCQNRKSKDRKKSFKYKLKLTGCILSFRCSIIVGGAFINLKQDKSKKRELKVEDAVTEEIMQKLGVRERVQLLWEYIYVKQTALASQPHWKRRATRQMGLHEPDPNAAKKSCSYTQNSSWPHILSKDFFFFFCATAKLQSGS